MASLHKLPVLIILSILYFFSPQSINADEDLLKLACASSDAVQLCTDLLKNDKEITAAATTNEVDLGLTIMKSIIAKTKVTHDYILKKKSENPVFDVCEKEWLDMVSGFERILEVTTKNKGYKEDTDDYDFHNVGEAIGSCERDLENKKIVDPEIKEKGDIVGKLMAAANGVLTHQKLKKEGQI
ncbi:hypothetical protein HAX54_005275 [Datura stramonium]|uniref:Pectinesterase inhibitor domain-containing protein n=1 Tax=Datura stramonium TaxID=4076 RepID=A0ABS8T9T7_DATST|nr:hypothetical protein [Datura stramonium]